MPIDDWLFKLDTRVGMRRGLCLLVTLAAAKPAASVTAGTWYDPANPGYGVAVDLPTPESGVIFWYTYDKQGQPMPVFASATRTPDGSYAGQAFLASGPKFNVFDPAALSVLSWGNLQFRQTDCSVGELAWEASAGLGAGAEPLRRLLGEGCLPPIGGVSNVVAQFAGTWHNPQLQGLGVNVQDAGQGNVAVYWYTYDEHGRPLPAFMLGALRDNAVEGHLSTASGLTFGTPLGGELSVRPFGTATLVFYDCASAQLRYDTPLGAGLASLVRLTGAEGSNCTPSEFPAGLKALYDGAALRPGGG